MFRRATRFEDALFRSHFEAGAIAKSLDESKLAPLLFGLRPTDVLQPLSQFQVTEFSREEMLKLLHAINNAADPPLIQEARMVHLFESLWPELDASVQQTLTSHTPSLRPQHRSSEEVLEEILILSREHAITLANPERLLGRTIQDLTGQVMDAYFSAEARLTESERNQILALLGRWKALSTQLIAHLKNTEDQSLTANSLRSRVAQFERYVNEARLVLDRDRNK